MWLLVPLLDERLPFQLPKPVQSAPPIVIGGVGAKRTPWLAARFAAEFNQPFMPIDQLAAAQRPVVEACETTGRDLSTMVFSTAQETCVGADEGEFGRRAEAIGRQPDEMRKIGVSGTVDEARAKLARITDAGITRVYLQVLDLDDHDHLHLLTQLS